MSIDSKFFVVMANRPKHFTYKTKKQPKILSFLKGYLHLKKEGYTT